MKKPTKKQKEQEYLDEDIAYSINFNRLNKITILNGILFIILAIINIPLLYNPELDQITFNLSGKPTFFFGGSLSFYLTAGLLPLIIGIIFIVFSLITGRPIKILLYKDGKARYIKELGGNLLLDTQVDFKIKDSLQRISLGKRHQRFVIWATVALMIYMVFLLSDFMNFMDPGFDIKTTFFGIEYSMKIFILINIFYIIGILLPFTLFPRKLCLIETSEAIVKFDYVDYEVKQIGEKKVALKYLKPFQLKWEKNESQKEVRAKNRGEISKDIPDTVKEKIKTRNFSHFPLRSALIGMGLLLIFLIPQFLPEFYMGGFTFPIEYFIIVFAFFLLITAFQKGWFSSQQIYYEDQNLFIVRKNLFGKSTEFYNQVEQITKKLAPRQPHFLEYVWFFFPIVQITWFFYNIFIFPRYFFTGNLYTILYFGIIIGFFLLMAAEYIFPKPKISIIPENQPTHRDKTQNFGIYFPENEMQKQLYIKTLFKDKGLIKNSVKGVLLLMIPVLIGIIWILLANLGIIPSLVETIL